MLASRSERRRAEVRTGLILLTVWIGLVPAAVRAQQPGLGLGPPIPLVPQPSIPPTALPEFRPAVSPDDGVVTSEPLASPFPSSPSPASPAPGWSAGSPPSGDALPDRLWRGATREMAELLLTRVPDTLSPALQSLERRLLLSPAAAPGEGSGETVAALAALRAAALLRLGELDAARAAVAAIPEPERGPALPLAVAADTIAGDIGQACATVREAIRRDQGVFWQAALIACQALQGETEQASIGLQLLAEEQVSNREQLALAVEALAGRPSPGEVTQAEGLDPLTLRLLVAARRPLAASLIEVLEPDLALCLALDEEAPSAIRLAAAERAARIGALPLDRLRALYSAMADDEAPSSESAFDPARRFAAIESAKTGAERLDRIVGFTDAFGKVGADGWMLAARLAAPALQDLEPEPSLAGAAPKVARLLIAAGESKTARRWSALAAKTGNRPMELLLGLATGSAMRHSADQEGAPTNPLSIVLSSALGAALTPAEWVRLPVGFGVEEGAPSNSAAAWLLLAEAVRAKCIGETVLAAIMVAAPRGTLSTDPVALFTAISALRQVGLAADARRLAVEAALAVGL